MNTLNPTGRIICAWCQTDLGPSGFEGNTHGCCPACAGHYFGDFDPVGESHSPPLATPDHNRPADSGERRCEDTPADRPDSLSSTTLLPQAGSQTKSGMAATASEGTARNTAFSKMRGRTHPQAIARQKIGGNNFNGGGGETTAVLARLVEDTPGQANSPQRRSSARPAVENFPVRDAEPMKAEAKYKPMPEAEQGAQLSRPGPDLSARRPTLAGNQPRQGAYVAADVLRSNVPTGASPVALANLTAGIPEHRAAGGRLDSDRRVSLARSQPSFHLPAPALAEPHKPNLSWKSDDCGEARWMSSLMPTHVASRTLAAGKTLPVNFTGSTDFRVRLVRYFPPPTPPCRPPRACAEVNPECNAKSPHENQ